LSFRAVIDPIAEQHVVTPKHIGLARHNTAVSPGDENIDRRGLP
jgi:hypothetical protein